MSGFGLNGRTLWLLGFMFVMLFVIYSSTKSNDKDGKGTAALGSKLLSSLTSLTNFTSQSGAYNLKTRLASSEISYQRYAKKRKNRVGAAPEKVDPWNGVYFWEYFIPTFSCPHAIDRVGALGDGGKFVCGLELFKPQHPDGRMNKPCVVYSFGVGGRSGYESELLELTNCEIFAYDFSSSGMGPEVKANDPRVHFHKLYLGSEPNENTATLKSMMETNGHEWIDFMKMDIEESDVGALNHIMDSFDILPFGQLSVELHGDQEGKFFPKMYALWERFEEKGLRAFKNEINNYHCVKLNQMPRIIEYSFLNLRGDHRIVSLESI